MAEETASAPAAAAPPPQAVRGAPRTALWVHVAGWYGVAAILGAYFLTTHDLLDADRVAALFLNVTGGAGVALLSWSKRAWQPMVLNLLWVAIGLSALWRLFV